VVGDEVILDSKRGNKISVKKRPAKKKAKKIRRKNKDSINVTEDSYHEELHNIKIEEIIAQTGYTKLYGHRKKWDNKELHAQNVEFGVLDSTYEFESKEPTESQIKTEKIRDPEIENSQTNSTKGANIEQESIIKSNSSETKEVTKSKTTIEKSDIAPSDTAGML